MEKEIILIGDKVLVKPESESYQTDSGLYLPAGIKEKEKVQIGQIVNTGPGYPMPDPSSLDSEPWSDNKKKDKYFPLQARVGDNCIFLRKEAIEIKIDGQDYLVIPHSAILVIVRGVSSWKIKDKI